MAFTLGFNRILASNGVASVLRRTAAAAPERG
jgi:hypothetical protein